MGEFRYLN